MADKMDEAEFWLPSEFLTDEDILMDNKENFCKHGLAATNPARLSFPPLFPYDCGGSPFDSLVGSAETESDEEDSLLTGLTHQLTLHDDQKLTSSHQNHERSWVLSGSPQSTLTQVGSWSCRSTVSSNGSPNGPSQVSSPPTTPLASNNDSWDLIYQAAGVVARLKMNSDGLSKSPGIMRQQKSVTTPPPLINPALLYFNNSPWQQLNGEQVFKHEGCGMWSGRQLKNRWSYDQEVFQNRGARVGVTVRNGSAVGGGFVPSSCAWPSLQARPRNQQQFGELRVRGGSMGGGYGYGYGSGSGNGGGGRRECAGTGVFLPRRYGNNNNLSNISDSRKKQGPSSALLQARGVQVLNKNPNNISSVIVHPQPQSELGGASFLDHDTLLARRNALLTQQRRNLCPDAAISHEICLPQEWTY